MPKRFLALIFFFAASALAHTGESSRPLPTDWDVWDFDPLVIVGLAISAVLYARGLSRL